MDDQVITCQDFAVAWVVWAVDKAVRRPVIVIQAVIDDLHVNSPQRKDNSTTIC